MLAQTRKITELEKFVNAVVAAKTLKIERGHHSSPFSDCIAVQKIARGIRNSLVFARNRQPPPPSDFRSQV